jgi:filamentous hemagglutinin family protein
MIRSAMAVVAGILIIMIPSLLPAGPAIPGFYGSYTPALSPVGANTVPVLKTGGIVYGASVATTGAAANQMTIYQTQPKAVIDWQTFNIGTNASVYFNQQGNSTWAALNRIWDSSPSQIWGTLKADGQVYLINQNGILFAPGSQVNVYGLIASSLNLNVDNWIHNGTLAFNTSQGSINTVAPGQTDGFYNPAQTPGVISNTGTIQTDNGGSVFLIGPQVENCGTIVTPIGQIGLAAGTDVDLASPSGILGAMSTYPGGQTRTSLVVTMNNSPQGSTASNQAGGYLAADAGVVGMYGNIVNQNGVIRSVTAVELGGHVELEASGTISTGPGSQILLPVDSSPTTYDVSFATAQGDVTFTGLSSNNPPSLIIHDGVILAPGSLITMNASQRVYLGPTSVIDVSGLWLNEPASAGLISLQMNSVNLRDNYSQKGGVLQGATIDISQVSGSSIGDVSGAFATQSLTAEERHTAGGTVNINVPAGNIVATRGATINFSGGGITYGAGALDTTELVSGDKVYKIGAAPADITYDQVLNNQTFASPKFGATQAYNGVYYGGAFPVNSYSASYTVGSNAGILSLEAGTVVLDGTILGLVTNGLQQVLAADPTNSTGNQSESGYVEATGGQLIVGNVAAAGNNNGIDKGDTANFVTQEIVVGAQAGPVLPATFQPTDPLPSSTTVLSASTLTKAGLSAISLTANTTITVEKGARITLNPGGTFNAWARRIDDEGGITALGGSINLALQTNVTSNQQNAGGTNPNYIPLDEMIYIGPAASLVARGERIDNSATGSLNQGVTSSGYTNGGSVSVLDQTVTGQGVAVMQGALIDVSGGWLIGPTGKVTGGNAGSVTMQGNSLVLEGTLQAQSLIGNKGGTVSLTAGNVTVAAATQPASYFAPGDPWPAGLTGQLVLGADQLDATGFTNITLKSVNDLMVQSGTSLGPSLAKLATPSPGGGTGDTAAAKGFIMGTTPTGSGVVQTTGDNIGGSSITLAAGASGSGITSGIDNEFGPLNPATPNYSAGVQVSPGAQIQAAPGGSITLKGPNIDVGGSLSAPAGSVTLTANAITPYGNVTIESGGSILAEGYNKPGTTSLVKGLPPDAVPLPGGTISITASNGLTLSPGSLISVSGSSPVPQTVIGQGDVPSYIMNASQPGSISLSAGGTIKVDPQAGLEGQAALAGLPGGTLSLSATGSTPLSLGVSDLVRFVDGGFDALTLSATGTLSLSNPGGLGQVAFGRSLTLSAQQIAGSGSDQISLSAPWVQMTSNALASVQPASGSAGLTLSGSFIDVTGNVVFSGFRSVTLSADSDVRLSDTLYGNAWSGLLETAGDLTLQAARVYPTTLSSFTIRAGGKVTVLPSGATVDGPIYSAGGSLTIQAAGGIDQEGYLAAPMGSLSLQATGTGLGGRVYLAPGSATTTAGDASVLYGVIQEAQDTVTLGDNIWAIPDKAHPTAAVPYVAVQNDPAKSISLKGDTVIVQNGATIDVSGGGSIFASRFVPSPLGSNSPLPGSYVIVPGVVLPGNGVYLSGITGLPAGTYSLLPATVDANGDPSAYVYMPGAMIITALNTTFSTGGPRLTADGYPIIGGYATVMGTNISSPLLQAYEVRPASVVLNEGSFTTQTLQAGEAGSVTITGQTTTILGGTVQASPLPGYSGGSIALSGSVVTVQASTVPLPSDFGFSTPVPAGLVGTLNVAAPSLSGQGFQTIGIGVSDLSGSAASVAASTVEIKPGVTLEAENIILGAKTSITLDPGAQVLALVGGTGQASLISPSGTVTIGAGAIVHASDAVNLQTANLDLLGSLIADHSLLNLQGSEITLVANGVSAPAGAGLILTQTQWNNFAAIFPDLGLTSASDIVFDGAFNLSATDALTIDAARIAAFAGSTAASQVAATSLVLQNTGATPSTTVNGKGTAQITFNATEMQIGPGTVLFDQFSTIGLNAKNDLTFKGAGSLSTGGADLSVSTARVATTYDMRPAGPAGSAAAALSPVYTPPDFMVNAGTGTVTIASSGGTAGTATTPGGTLQFNAGQIEVSTLIETPSAQLTLSAPGNIALDSGARLLARGSDSAPGGVVSLTSTNGGAVTLAAGSLIDVSAGSQGDAGTINLYAPIGGVALNGTIQGQAAGGKGGSFSLVTNNLDTVNGINQFSALNNSLAAGGFNETISIEASTGNITIAATDYVQAHNLTITAGGTNPDGTSNGGSIVLDGTIDAHYPGQGGTVGLYAQQDLTIDPTGYIGAQGTATAASSNATGGDVTLSVNTGMLRLAGGTIDVSGAGTGAGGTVTFVDPPPPPAGGGGAQTNMSLSGTIKGASSVTAEIDKVYVNQFQGPDGTGGVGTVIDSNAITQIQSDITTLMNADASLATELAKGLTDGNGNALVPYNASSGSGTFHLRPGVVVEQTTGDGSITLTQAGWDLSGMLYGGGNEPGTLTLRATGNLTINGNLLCTPTYNNDGYDFSQLLAGNLLPSWSFNLAAGARTTSPNPMAIMPAGSTGQGSLTIAQWAVVYTEKGAIRFASAGDTVINEGPENPFMVFPIMNYSLGTYSGPITGNVGGNLTINAGGAIQSATGSIDIRVGGDLNMSEDYLYDLGGTSLGSIRTTGEQRTPGLTVYDYYDYSGGGSITLNVAGAVNGNLNPGAWLAVTQGQAVPVTPVFDSISTEGIATMGGGSIYVRSGGSFNSQIGTFGQGDLQVYSGGDLTGRFLVEQGTGRLSAMGNFGMPTQVHQGVTQNQPQLIEMSAAQVSVFAQGNIELGAALNPNLAAAAASTWWDNGYTPQSSLSLTAVTGDVNLYGTVNAAQYGSFYLTGNTTTRNTLLPPSVAISAGTDINVIGGNPFIQLPSPTGSLTMAAGRDIVFSTGATWLMSDADPTSVYVPIQYGWGVNSSLTLLRNHAASPVHTGDAAPVTISAGRDIKDATLTLPEMATITAGRDILDITYDGQNIGPNDVTAVVAGGDILFGSTNNVTAEKIQVGGPGFLVVKAGGTIDLGYSSGILEIGNSENPALAPGGSLIVAAGISTALSPQAVVTFFQGLQNAGTEYSELQAAGDAAGAQSAIINARTNIIGPFLGQTNSSGDISMTSSQVSTTGGGAINMLAAGSLDVGTTELNGGQTSGQTRNTGILTEHGGAINVFANGDVNVNESRIMSFMGGDITVWSDKGNINAGKGSKATISVSAPTYSCKNGVCSVTFNPPAVGSGIRALTYAPNETTPAPPAGDIYLFAPQGVIDAGEAGISGGKVILGAVTVLNVANISFTSGSVGVPAATQTVSLGALTGTTNLAATTIVSQDSGALGSARGGVGNSALQTTEDIMKWFDVRFISFDLTSPVAGGEEPGGP